MSVLQAVTDGSLDTHDHIHTTDWWCVYSGEQLRCPTVNSSVLLYAYVENYKV